VGELEQLEERLQVRFDNRTLLRQALVHRSYAFEQGGLETNERLEFLGDAVLAVVVTMMLYEQYPDAPEGTLAKLRAAAVRADALAAVGRELDLGAFVRLGKGETASGGADKDSILGDTLEGLIGAVYVDRGFVEADALVRRLFGPRLGDLAERGPALDYKTSLQELVAARYETIPVYELTEEGPDHEKSFTASVLVGGEVRGRGSGGSKKKAEQAAAREAYRSLTASRSPDGDSGPSENPRADAKETEGAGTP
jgi:ribonuclease III